MMRSWHGRVAISLVILGAGLLGCSSEGQDEQTHDTQQGPALGEGPRALQREELCFEECAVEEACGISSDPDCDAYCDRREQGCKADLMSDECFDALVALQECAIGLTCDELLAFRGRVNVAVKPCAAESTAYHDNDDCPGYNYYSFGDACGEGS